MTNTIGMRGLMALMGGLAGLSLYALSEVLTGGLLPVRAALLLVAVAAAFFTGVLAMWGPLPLRRAAPGAAGIALMSGGLLALASARYANAEDVFQDGSAFPAYLVTALIPLPFWIAASGQGWRDYAALFTHAWGIFIRYVCAFLFVLIVWGLIYLSDSLLGIVGIDAIDRIIDLDPAPWIITGVTLGVAMAVANEMSEVISPFIVLRLLRVLLPLVLVVMTVFIIALPVQGASGIFGEFSAAATLLAMCVAAATLVTAAIDRRDEDAVHLPVMTLAARALAAILPVPAALALWAVGMRVGDYGWTPSRILAVLAAGLSLAYGVVYLLAVLRGSGWMGRIRRGNVWLAVLLVALAALWQTPLLDVERISSRSQFDRIASGQVPVAEVEIRSFERWGVAGQRALDGLDDLAVRNADLAQRLTVLRRVKADVTATEVASIMPVRPESEAALRDRIIAGMDQYQLTDFYQRCTRSCIMVIGPFDPADPEPQALVISSYGNDIPYFEGFALVGDRTVRREVLRLAPEEGASAMIQALLDGGVRFSPNPQNWIEIPGGVLSLGR